MSTHDFDRLDRALSRANVKAHGASEEALKALRAAYPAGREVQWMHGDQRRSAVVVEVIGFTYENACIRVQSSTGAVYDVAKYPIMVGWSN